MIERSPSGRYIRWQPIIDKLSWAPESWCYRLIDEPVRIARNIEERSSPALHLPEPWRIQTRIVNPYVDAYGIRRGDIWLRLTKLSSLPEGGSIPSEGS